VSENRKRLIVRELSIFMPDEVRAGREYYNRARFRAAVVVDWTAAGLPIFAFERMGEEARRSAARGAARDQTPWVLYPRPLPAKRRSYGRPRCLSGEGDGLSLRQAIVA
jgi:hypothetical protein